MSNVKEPKLDLQLSEDNDGDNGFDWLHDSMQLYIYLTNYASVRMRKWGIR